MLYEDIFKHVPDSWTSMDISKRYEMFQVCPNTLEYDDIYPKFQQARPDMGPMYRIQNPLLFTKFYLKSAEYAARGPYDVLTLYHDTVQANVDSIATFNVDWRYGERYKYGPGVYFSTSAFKAQRRSNISLGPYRAMFLFDVLVGKNQTAKKGTFHPDVGYDTVVSPDGDTYVKYFDHEFYPTYVLYYLDARFDMN